MREAECLLIERGCPKINLLVRSANAEVIEFYRRLGYMPDDVVGLGRRLIHDAEPRPLPQDGRDPSPARSERCDWSSRGGWFLSPRTSIGQRDADDSPSPLPKGRGTGEGSNWSKAQDRQARRLAGVVSTCRPGSERWASSPRPSPPSGEEREKPPRLSQTIFPNSTAVGLGRAGTSHTLFPRRQTSRTPLARLLMGIATPGSSGGHSCWPSGRCSTARRWAWCW